MDSSAQSAETLRDKAREFVERRSVTNAILGIIIFNAITLGLGTSAAVRAHAGGLLDVIDTTVLAIFVLELALKLFAYGWRFFSSAWNIFDLVVVSFGLFPDSQGLSALRGLRVVRALRLLSVIPQMRAVVQALLDALPGMGAVIVMISIVFYVFGVMATMMYGAAFDEWFGTLGRSLYSLFQIMTLESWSMGIVRPVMEEFPFAWSFFVPFIVITAFSVLNLFIGLLVNTMQSAVEADAEAEFEKLRELVKSETDVVDEHVREMHEEIKALRAELAELKGQGNG
ncbi:MULTISPECIES: ion transporter [unclassified Leisingera]|uniref:ion transporter n=1 Tax=unclassified Leisingera TaxID=2614906 RepID=UPI0002E9DFC7|nr:MULTISPECIES: ion transporter [unclassified Leisingera]KIC23711.1 voltage-gated sodium channel [Leisingera sp. ANG-S3]KIC24018.1 voltage-gated sodium channel [Leisingera sp. ANG-M6]KIC32428.1 voltage-gated sodium channel [Leisingera sp. ANG-S5]KIC51571.1 voltage-gated sodium channel [Leisingera sp. ANG-S]KID07652.1 voltage-gated sodium channel [Leisingera sp. ANG1]